jgi:hypothetical protein
VVVAKSMGMEKVVVLVLRDRADTVVKGMKLAEVVAVPVHLRLCWQLGHVYRGST